MPLPRRHWRNIARPLLLMCATTVITLQAQTFTTLHSFDGPDGSEPFTVIQGTDGNLYGTTFAGGTSGACAGGCGTAFQFTLGGMLKTLSFDSTNGYEPSGLIQATNGNFYGAALGGGSNGDGAVFKITPTGTLTTLYSFCSLSNCADGNGPSAVAFQGTDGNFYGATEGGGANPTLCGGFGCGTVFELTPTGTLTTLYSFCSLSNCTDGSFPELSFQGTDGNFYGTTSDGGANPTLCGGVGCGTVFKLTPAGLTTLYSFCSQSGCTDGSRPFELVQATDGNFYGTTNLGGANSDGTVFKITPSGTLTTLYAFCSLSGCTDGSHPYGLIQATDGNLYGTTGAGGTNNQGTVFKVTSSGTLTTVYSFCSQSGCTDGAFPNAAPVQDTNGTFYGTTLEGGASGDGVIFSLSVGLHPFVETEPSSGKVRAPVKILGSNLAGATSVTFNGTTAVFKASSSFITTAVPAGATTGFVTVTVPSGKLRSNKKFSVQP